MVGTTPNWKDELGRWLKPFLNRLGHKARRQMCPANINSAAPMARSTKRSFANAVVNAAGVSAVIT